MESYPAPFADTEMQDSSPTVFTEVLLKECLMEAQLSLLNGKSTA